MKERVAHPTASVHVHNASQKVAQEEPRKILSLLTRLMTVHDPLDSSVWLTGALALRAPFLAVSPFSAKLLFTHQLVVQFSAFLPRSLQQHPGPTFLTFGVPPIALKRPVSPKRIGPSEPSNLPLPVNATI